VRYFYYGSFGDLFVELDEFIEHEVGFCSSGSVVDDDYSCCWRGREEVVGKGMGNVSHYRRQSSSFLRELPSRSMNVVVMDAIWGYAE